MEDSDEEEEVKAQDQVGHDAALAHIDGLIQEDDASLCDKIMLRQTIFLTTALQNYVFIVKTVRKKAGLQAPSTYFAHTSIVTLLWLRLLQ